MAKSVNSLYRKAPAKRTSQGLYDRPKNKHRRRNWKAYRGQGHP
jgi:hypothetical protein